MRELKPDLAHALSPGGPALAGPDGVGEVWPLWRYAASQRVRDLAWCSLAPPLLSRLPMAEPAFHLAHWPAESRAAWVRWLAAADPATLPETIAELADQRGAGERLAGGSARGAGHGARAANRSLRLGRHAERLLQFALSHAPGLELLAANVPVRHRHDHGIRTLGELDFVWRDPVRDEVVHWEMATKFYLHVDTGAATPCLRAFVGPNLVDRLGDKLEHIVRRQLPLGDTPEARAALGRGIDRGEVYLLGWLFYRDGVLPPGLDALGIAPDHLRGWWSTLDAWAARAAARPASRWCRLSRADWLSAMRVDVAAPAGELVFEEVSALRAALATRFDDPDPEQSWRREAPVMLCELAPAGPHGHEGWIEISRGFVVPEGWEARAVERVGRP
ncbi:MULTISPECIES: DUF1853 family protein [Cupriavidus]|uniref:DUF1853 family protein n=1 Tax=Cupriavidus pauculus TaxID=82633 RepID=A0A5P2H3S8_9BURK|nr:DUF1853 family protein [Cupriavidus pauculus]QET01970.1 DUF1853 family protein [Cupriavidus pauculus]